MRNRAEGPRSVEAPPPMAISQRTRLAVSISLRDYHLISDTVSLNEQNANPTVISICYRFPPIDGVWKPLVDPSTFLSEICVTAFPV